MTSKVFLDLAVKAVSDDERRIEGWATIPDADRVGDVVVPKGAVYSLPLPFLLDHDHKLAVGEVDRVEVSHAGIKFWAHIKKIAEPGEAKDLTDKAWSLVKNGLRRAVSIGFRPLEQEPLGGGGLKFKRWEWLELSAVSVPAQAGARITSAKNYGAPTQALRVGLTEYERAQMAEVKRMHERIFGWTEFPEIPAASDGQAEIGKSHRVVKLDPNPFVIRNIHRATEG